MPKIVTINFQNMEDTFFTWTLFLSFKCANYKTKELFVSAANSPVVGTYHSKWFELMSISSLSSVIVPMNSSVEIIFYLV